MADDVSVKFGADTADVNDGIDSVSNKLDELGDKAPDISDKFADMGKNIVGAFAVDKVIDFTKSVLESANSIYIMSERVGVAASTLSALNIPLKQNGSSIEEFAGSLRFMNRNIEEAEQGNTKLIGVFNDLGLSVTKLKSLSPEQQFYDIASALGKVTDQGKFTNDVMSLFGRNGIALAPIIKENNGDLAEMVIHTKELGEALTDKDIDKVHQFDDAWTSFIEHIKTGTVQAVVNVHGLWDALLNPPFAGQNNKTIDWLNPDTTGPAQGPPMMYGEQYGPPQSAQGNNNDITSQLSGAGGQNNTAVTDSIDQQVKAMEKGLATQEKDTDAATKAMSKDYEQMFQPITRGFDTMVTGVLQGTQTWQQAMQHAASNMLISYIEMDAKRLVNWVSTELARAKASAMADELCTTSAADSAATSSGFGFLKAIKSIEADAAETYAGVFAFLAPVMGPFAAGPAAVAAGLVGAMSALVPSFDVGTPYVPSTGLAMIHQGEAIIPASQNTGGGGGNQFNITIQAIDTQTGAQFLQSNARTIASVLSNQVRNMNSASPAWKAS